MYLLFYKHNCEYFIGKMKEGIKLEMKLSLNIVNVVVVVIKCIKYLIKSLEKNHLPDEWLIMFSFNKCSNDNDIYYLLAVIIVIQLKVSYNISVDKLKIRFEQYIVYKSEIFAYTSSYIKSATYIL